MSRQSSSFCLILSITRPQSLWNLNCKQRNSMQITKSEIRDKQICLLGIIFLKLQVAGTKFEKLLGWTVFESPNFNPFLACERQTILLAHRPWGTFREFLLAKRPSAAMSEEKRLPFAGQSVSIFFSFAHSWHLLFLLCYFNLPPKFYAVIFMFLLINGNL